MTLTRIGIGIIAVAFLMAEVWRPTVPHAKKVAGLGLIAATHEGQGGARTMFDPDLLDDLPRIVGIPLGNIDALSTSGPPRRFRRAIDVAPDTGVQLAGWLADSQARTPGAAVFLILDGKRLPGADVWYGGVRPDVAAYYATPALRRTAFVARLPAKTLRLGTDTLGIGLISADERGFYLAPQALTLHVSPSAKPVYRPQTHRIEHRSQHVYR